MPKLPPLETLKSAARALAAFSLSACIVFLSACSRERPADRACKDKILLVGNASDPATLDPALATGFPEYRILSALYEGLLRADTKTLEPLPAAAKSWSVSGDGKIYTFKIDELAKWSDGSKVSASDFVYAWQRILDPALGAEYASMLFPLKNARKINSGELSDFSMLGAKALSDSVLRVELERPLPYFASLLYHPAYFPIKRELVEKFGARRMREGLWCRPGNLVSNGPFMLSEWKINDKVGVRKNPNFRDAKNVHLNGIEFFPISNINTEDRAFRAGQLHVTESISPIRIESIKRDMPGALRRDEWFGLYYYAFNTRVPPFDNPKVRRALSMAIDRKAIIDAFLKAGQKPALNFVPSNCDSYKPIPESLIKEDIDSARKLLAEAGYPEGKGFPEFRIVYNTSEQHKPIAEAIQQMWRDNLGISAQLYNMSWPAYLGARRSGDFEVMRASWIGDFAAPEAFLGIFESSSGLNHTGFSSAMFDSLLARSEESKDKEARLRLLAGAEKILMDSSPIIPIYFYSKVYLLSEHVKNWNANLLDYRNFAEIFLEQGQNAK